jgi:hypothetical protein
MRPVGLGCAYLVPVCAYCIVILLPHDLCACPRAPPYPNVGANNMWVPWYSVSLVSYAWVPCVNRQGVCFK